MAVKDADDEFFREIIKAIIPSLNGHDPDKLVQVDYGVDKLADDKHYGPKVMAKTRLLCVCKLQQFNMGAVKKKTRRRKRFIGTTKHSV